MIEESLLKSNFIGRDGFRWWIGQIPPIDAMGNQTAGGGWGNRYKVRILGHHPYSKSQLEDKDLPWAGCLLPATSGTGASNFAQSVKYRPGDVVVGFFMDGDNAQIPMIMGSFGRTSEVPTGPAEGGFEPFTGFTDTIPVPEGTLPQGPGSQSNEQNSESQPSPRSVSLEQAKKITNEERDEVPASKALGQQVVSADTCDDNFMGELSAIIDNFLSVLGVGQDFFGDISSVAKKIQKLANSPVSTMMNSLYNTLIPVLSEGIKNIKDLIAAVFGELVGQAAVAAFIPAVFDLQKKLECLPGKILDGLLDTIYNMLEDTVMNVVNGGVCIAEQFASKLFSGIVDDIIDGISGPLEQIVEITDLLSLGFLPVPGPLGDFSPKNFLLSSKDVFASVGAFFGCGQDTDKCKGNVKKWTIGYGSDGSFDLVEIYDNIAKQVSVTNALDLLGVEVPQGVNSLYTKPDCSEPTFCGGPSVKIFGGDGIGGAGRAILGGFVNNTSGLSDITSSVTRTASIIGIEITDPGSSYFSRPPLISFSDSCGLGYGAVGQATIDTNKKSDTYGQIVNVVMLSEGENYPAIGGGPDDIDSPIPTEEPIAVIGSVPIIPGGGYVITDPELKITDNIGTEYKPVIEPETGSIISVSPINTVVIDVENGETLPVISVRSSIGSGAFIKPIIGKVSPPTTELVQVIDCVR